MPPTDLGADELLLEGDGNIQELANYLNESPEPLFEEVLFTLTASV